MKRSTSVIAGIALLAIVAAGAIGAYRFAAPAMPVRPAFTLPDLAGTPRAIGDFDGRVIVLNFWASWCGPCREEIPMLVAAQDKWGPRGLQIIGVAIDTRGAATAFADRYHINYPVLADATEGPRVQDQYTRDGTPAGVLPYTTIIDRSGRIRARIAGALTDTQLANQIKPLLESTEPSN